MSTHAHFVGEFGSQKMTKKLEKDPVYRAARAEYFAKAAHTARYAHSQAINAADKAKHALEIAHAMSRVKSHMNAVKKLAPDDHALNAKAQTAHEQVKAIHEEVNGKSPKLGVISGSKTAPTTPSTASLSVAPKLTPIQMLAKEWSDYSASQEKKSFKNSSVPLGEQKMNKGNEKNPEYRAARAEHFANEAKTAAENHAKATSVADKAMHLATAAHAAARAKSHANAVHKLVGNSDHYQKAYSAQLAARQAHKSILKGTNTSSLITTPPSSVSSHQDKHTENTMSGLNYNNMLHESSVQTLKDKFHKTSDIDTKKALIQQAEHVKSAALKNMDTAVQTNAMSPYMKKIEYHLTKINSHLKEMKSDLESNSVKELSSAEFKSHRKEFDAKITDKEKYALLAYSGNAYLYINQYLRTGKDVEKIHLDNIPHIDNAIAKTSVPKDILVFRGAGGMDVYDHYAKMNIGDHYIEKGYSSTSALKGKAFNGKVTIHITVPKGGKAAAIPSDHEHEKEILLPRGQKFRVDHVDHKEYSYGSKQMTLHVTAVQD